MASPLIMQKKNVHKFHQKIKSDTPIIKSELNSPIPDRDNSQNSRQFFQKPKNDPVFFSKQTKIQLQKKQESYPSKSPRKNEINNFTQIQSPTYSTTNQNKTELLYAPSPTLQQSNKYSLQKQPSLNSPKKIAKIKLHQKFKDSNLDEQHQSNITTNRENDTENNFNLNSAQYQKSDSNLKNAYYMVNTTTLSQKNNQKNPFSKNDFYNVQKLQFNSQPTNNNLNEQMEPENKTSGNNSKNNSFNNNNKKDTSNILTRTSLQLNSKLTINTKKNNFLSQSTNANHNKLNVVQALQQNRQKQKLTINPEENSQNLNSPLSTKKKTQPVVTKRSGIVKSFSASTHQGLVRDYNEDRVSIILNIVKSNKQEYQDQFNKSYPVVNFMAVYDGHGGKACADYLRDNLHSLIVEDINFPFKPIEAIKNGHKKLEQNFCEMAKAKSPVEKSGSCSISALFVDDMCYVANVGDSRAIISEYGGKLVYSLSKDHKPQDLEESNRIKKAGGKIYQKSIPKQITEGENKGSITQLVGPHRVFPGRLSVTRTFGDIEAKDPELGGNPNCVISTPDIRAFKISKDHDFIVLASDGIYDKLENEEICKSIYLTRETTRTTNIHDFLGEAVDNVLKLALSHKTLDNITVVIIAFDNFKQTIFEKNSQRELNPQLQNTLYSSISITRFNSNFYKNEQTMIEPSNPQNSNFNSMYNKKTSQQSENFINLQDSSKYKINNHQNGDQISEKDSIPKSRETLDSHQILPSSKNTSRKSSSHALSQTQLQSHRPNPYKNHSRHESLQYLEKQQSQKQEAFSDREEQITIIQKPQNQNDDFLNQAKFYQQQKKKKYTLSQHKKNILNTGTDFLSTTKSHANTMKSEQQEPPLRNYKSNTTILNMNQIQNNTQPISNGYMPVQNIQDQRKQSLNFEIYNTAYKNYQDQINGTLKKAASTNQTEKNNNSKTQRNSNNALNSNNTSRQNNSDLYFKSEELQSQNQQQQILDQQKRFESFEKYNKEFEKCFEKEGLLKRKQSEDFYLDVYSNKTEQQQQLYQSLDSNNYTANKNKMKFQSEFTTNKNHFISSSQSQNNGNFKPSNHNSNRNSISKNQYNISNDNSNVNFTSSFDDYSNNNNNNNNYYDNSNINQFDNGNNQQHYNTVTFSNEQYDYLSNAMYNNQSYNNNNNKYDQYLSYDGQLDTGELYFKSSVSK